MSSETVAFVPVVSRVDDRLTSSFSLAPDVFSDLDRTILVVKEHQSLRDRSLEPESFQAWHIPFSQDQITLREAYTSLTRLGAKQSDIPLAVQLVENPRFHIPGINIFHGAVGLATHDYIHILLGRGLLQEDEAFVIGFTMGSTKKVTSLEENLYGLASKYLYPKGFRFGKKEMRVFKNAIKLAHVSDCQPLDTIDYAKYLDWNLRDIRQNIGLGGDLLLAYYRIEQKSYPEFRGSQRLLL